MPIKSALQAVYNVLIVRRARCQANSMELHKANHVRAARQKNNNVYNELTVEKLIYLNI
jgi:hypothetical protein